MPLHHARTAKGIRANISRNISAEKHAHPRMSIRQATAIAYSTARADAKRAHIKVPKGIK